MRNLFYTDFDTVFDSYLNWDIETKANSIPTSFIKDDILKIEFEVPGLSNKDVDIKVEDRFLLINAEKENRKLERKYKIHESFDLGSTSAICKDGLLKIEIPKYEDRKAKSITVKVK